LAALGNRLASAPFGGLPPLGRPCTRADCGAAGFPRAVLRRKSGPRGSGGLPPLDRTCARAACGVAGFPRAVLRRKFGPRGSGGLPPLDRTCARAACGVAGFPRAASLKVPGLWRQLAGPPLWGLVRPLFAGSWRGGKAVLRREARRRGAEKRLGEHSQTLFRPSRKQAGYSVSWAFFLGVSRRITTLSMRWSSIFSTWRATPLTSISSCSPSLGMALSWVTMRPPKVS
jgi:hypothetical protein